MGFYINPVGQTKEQWLDRKGFRVSEPLPPSQIPVNQRLICLVVNPFFSAAGLCYDDREFTAFSDPKDNRPKSWWLVKVDDLKDPGAGLDPGGMKFL
jgi:hypothetical protein